MMTLEEIKSLMVPELDKELKSILSFWENNTIDKEMGGFVGEINGSGLVESYAEKSAVLNTRILWTFSAAYNTLKDLKYLALAERSYDYLINNFWDKENGGVFWSLNSDGSAHNNRKQAYAQGFAIYGFSEYYKASGNKESLDYAVKLFNLIETKFTDKKHGGYIEALTTDWQPLEDMRLSEKDANQPKSMNTHLHIIEPYTNLYKYWPNPKLKTSINDLIEIFRDKIIDQETSHFNLFFDLDWTVKSDIVSYGHDIEGAWLLNEAAHCTGNEELIAQIKTLSLKMVNVTMSEGLDKDGSVYYELSGAHLDTDKHWWPQAEALVGLLDAYQNSSEKKYLDASHKVWRFILNHIKDKENGEWFWKVDENGVPDPELPKAGFWKCPYHNSRAMMESINCMSKIFKQ